MFVVASSYLGRLRILGSVGCHFSFIEANIVVENFPFFFFHTVLYMITLY